MCSSSKAAVGNVLRKKTHLNEAGDVVNFITYIK